MIDSGQQDSGIIGDRYRVLETLGTGGMGSVHAALDLSTGERVAVKRLTAEGEHQRKLFEREYRTLKSLRHPRIVEVYEYGVHEGCAYYTMELLEGQDLTHAAPMPWRDACLCMRDAASILGVLHARQLVHRDLSPRNLWRCADGRLKLLDFGALTPFGVAKEVVGTPPLVPPEVLLRQELDARSDLYALGALGYWLLTSAHAFRANKLGELPRLWEQEPPPPSRLDSLIRSTESEVPEALDRLVMALLRRDKAERPQTTAEVIDTLNDVAALEPESQEVVVSGYLRSSAFVGRETPRRAFRKGLTTALKGKPQSLLIEGDEGMGCSRLLGELAMSARLKGALVLHCDASCGEHPFAAASALALALLRAAPQRTRPLAAPRASVLACLSPEVQRALGDASVPVAGQDAAAQGRGRKQAALADWFAEVSRERTLVILVEDLHAIDEDSRALLTTLAYLGEGHRVMLVCATAAHATPSPAMRSLAGRSQRQTLAPLTSDETRGLLRSIFGEAQNLDRVVSRLQVLSEGNPGHLMMLVEHLVDTHVARYIEGSWSLPKELPEQDLPRSIRAGLVAALDKLTPEARVLAARLSVPDRGAITFEMCHAVHEGPRPVGAVLAELGAACVLRKGPDGFTFSHPALREALLRKLPDSERSSAHRALGHALGCGATEDHTACVRAGLHLVRGGEVAEGEARIAQAARFIVDGSAYDVREVAILFEQAVDALSQLGRRDLDMLYPLTALCWASYYADPRYASRFGHRTVQALRAVLHLRWLSGLQRVVGRRLALLMVLVVSAIMLRRVRNAPPMREAVRCLISACSTLGGVAATALEPKLAASYAAQIKPLTALGPDHMATAAYRLLKVVALSATERCDETHTRSVRLRDWIGSGTPLKEVTPELREAVHSAAWFMYGIRAAFRDDGTALVAADHLREFGRSYEINAHQLRAMHYASRGDTQRAAYHRERMGVLAVQVGTGWRAEAFAPTITMPLIWAHDAVALKRAAEQLERLMVEFPGYAHHARSARAAYHLLRGKPHLAVQLLERHASEPLQHAGWARTRSVLAAAYNELRHYTDARKVCLDALAHLSEADLEFVGLNITLSMELAVAEAGLGDPVQGAGRLDQWIERCRDRGPLLSSYLHRTRARVALMAGDTEACRHHLNHAERYARETTTPSPLAAIRHLENRLRDRFDQKHRREKTSLLESSVELTAVVNAMLQGTTPANVHRGEKVLRVAAEVAGAHLGYFVGPEPDGKPLSLDGDAPPEELLRWARARLLEAVSDEDLTDDLPEDETPLDPNVRTIGGRHYCLKSFCAYRRGVAVPIGALVLGFETRSAQLPAPDVLTVLSTYLTEAVLPSQTQAFIDRSRSLRTADETVA